MLVFLEKHIFSGFLGVCITLSQFLQFFLKFQRILYFWTETKKMIYILRHDKFKKK